MKKIILLFFTFIFINLNSYSITEKHFKIEEIKKYYSPYYDVKFSNKSDMLVISYKDFSLTLKINPTKKSASILFENLLSFMKKENINNFVELYREDINKNCKIITFTNERKEIFELALIDEVIISIKAINFEAYVDAKDLIADLINNYSIKTNNK